ncbi:alkaline phosphatase family protein, partial [Caballeronia telluris]|uniref:alkaline phosphatase family protein n=1 Tax=Caballeronia telluris TaxID=326475 RepID=UPI003898E983
MTFDEHGGFFDHVRPPPAVPPGAQENPRLKEHNFSFDRLGVRVPALVISPHVPAGTIDHTEAPRKCRRLWILAVTGDLKNGKRKQ